jgi:hypothetical protein
MHPPSLTAAIGSTLLVLTGLLTIAGLLLVLVWAVRQLSRLVVAVLVEAVASQTEPSSAAEAELSQVRHDDASVPDHHEGPPASEPGPAIARVGRRVAVYGCICVPGYGPGTGRISPARVQAQLAALEARGWTWTLIDLDGPTAPDRNPSGTPRNRPS